MIDFEFDIRSRLRPTNDTTLAIPKAQEAVSPIVGVTAPAVHFFVISLIVF